MKPLRVPLTCVVDHCGLRCVAMAVLPLDRLAYGSDDAGQTVHTDVAQLNASMGWLGGKLGLAPHRVGRTHAHPIPLCVAVDVEGHEGKDGEFYVVDTARLFPPEHPRPTGAPGVLLYTCTCDPLCCSHPHMHL
jgi:hypothetical protein